MNAHTACPRTLATPELRLVAATTAPAEPADESAAGGLFDRLFNAWARRVERTWQERGWRDVRDLPYY